MEFLESLLFTVVGSILSILLPKSLVWFRNLKSKELYKEWFSEWMPMNDHSHYWTKEKLIFKNGFGKIKFQNKDNVNNYEWGGTLSQVDKRYLYGKWESKKQGAYSCGTVMLAKSSQGDCLFGYMAGANERGTMKMGKIVIAKDQKGIEKAKKMFSENAEFELKKAVTSDAE